MLIILIFVGNQADYRDESEIGKNSRKTKDDV